MNDRPAAPAAHQLISKIWEIANRLRGPYRPPQYRLLILIKAMADVDLHPDRVDNLQMEYPFEYLVMKFKEQANEEASDRFTPCEMIRLMANPVYTD